METPHFARSRAIELSGRAPSLGAVYRAQKHLLAAKGVFGQQRLSISELRHWMMVRYPQESRSLLGAKLAGSHLREKVSTIQSVFLLLCPAIEHWRNQVIGVIQSHFPAS
jgi:hypothetical protein